MNPNDFIDPPTFYSNNLNILEKCDKTHLVARIKELENDAFTSALKNCKSKKKELSATFHKTTLSNDVSCFKKHKTKKR